MSLGFITGRIGANRTEKLLELCFKEAKTSDIKPIYILVPEKYTYEMEKKLSEMLEDENNTDPNFRIRVVSFSTLSKIVFTNVGGLKERKLSTSARSMLTFKAMDSVSKELVSFKSKDYKMGFVNKIMDMIIEFKQSGNSVDSLFDMLKNIENDSLREKFNDLVKIYSSYEELIENKYLDTEDSLNVFSKKLDEFVEIEGASIFVDEYMDFTPAQYEVIEKLICLSKNIYFSLLTDLKNINSKMNIFNRSNATYLNLKEICLKNNIDILENIKVSNERHYESDVLLHLEKNISKYSPTSYEKESFDVKSFSFKNAYQEITFVAEEILRLIQTEKLRYNDIMICTRELNEYSYIVDRVFSDYKIGYFLDEKISVVTNPIVILISSILEMKNSNYSYDSVFRYLKSGLTGISDEDIFLLENYVIANGIRGMKFFEKWNKPILHNVDEESNISELEKINEIKERVTEPLLSLHNKLKGRNTVKEICTYLYEFTLDIKLFDRIDEFINKFTNDGNLYKAKEYSQVWGLFISILDELVEFMGDEKISIDKFINLMNTNLETLEIGIVPPSKDEVFVTSVERMKKTNSKIVFVIGFNEGKFPQNITDNAILRENERQKLTEKGLKFTTDNLLKLTDEQFLIYKALSFAKKRLYITFPTSNLDGGTLLPSMILKKIKLILPKFSTENIEIKKNFEIFDVFSTFSKERLYEIFINNIKDFYSNKLSKKEQSDLTEIENFLSNDDYYKNKINSIKKALNFKNDIGDIKEFAEKLYNSGVFSISKLEKFSSCPFSYFMTYGLKLKERTLYEFSPIDYGTYCHKVLDVFYKDVSENNIDWNVIDDEFISLKVGEITEQIFEKDGYILNSSEKYKYLSGLMNKNLKESLGIMAEQIRRGKFVPNGFETSFGGKNGIKPICYKLDSGKEINLIGKIDRLDILKTDSFDYLRVIDYKSSKKGIDMNSVYSGLQLQLFVYMNALLGQNVDRFKPAALLYSDLTTNLSDKKNFTEFNSLDFNSIYKEKLKKNRLNGFVIKDMDLISNLDSTIGEENQTSEILPIALKNKGMDIGENTKGLTSDEFEVVNEFVINKTKDICEKIYSGNIDLKPYRYAEKNACEYCKYKSICKFDVKKDKYREVEKLTVKNNFDEVLNRMSEENEKKRGTANE